MTDATTTTLAVTTSWDFFGSTATLTLTVAAATFGVGTPTGSVDFYDNYNGVTTYLGTEALGTSGTATLTTPPLYAGTHDFTAVYSGDGTFVQSTSPRLRLPLTGRQWGPYTIRRHTTSVAEGTQYSLDLPTTAGGYSITGWSFNWGDGTGWTCDGKRLTHTFARRATIRLRPSRSTRKATAITRRSPPARALRWT